MSHQISYIVLESGDTFNKRLDPRFIADAEDIHRLTSEGGLWDARLCESDVDFLAELGGQMTILFLPWNYSLLLTDRDITSKVHDWEESLRRAVTVRIIRCDELLLQDWANQKGDLWFQNATSIEKFIEWLERQDQRQWSDVTRPARAENA